MTLPDFLSNGFFQINKASTNDGQECLNLGSLLAYSRIPQLAVQWSVQTRDFDIISLVLNVSAFRAYPSPAARMTPLANMYMMTGTNTHQ